MRTMIWKTLASSLAYLGIAAACVIHWTAPNPWERFDWFAACYFGLRFVGSLHSIISSIAAFRFGSLRREWWALNSDPTGPRWVVVLMGLDLIVFFDYGHWQVATWLVRPALQILGVTLYFVITFWQIWTDSCLARYFDQNRQPLLPMNHGPYRYVRHPRYAAAIFGKVAMALTFGSLFGWILAIAWGALLLKKIAVEERHLRKLFGLQYDLYTRTTAKVIPGLY